MPELVRQSELETARRWLNEAFLLLAPGSSRFPVYFHSGGDEPPGSPEPDSLSRFDGWTARGEPATVEQGVTKEMVVVLRDPQIGLECRCETRAYADFPAVEWVVCFRNAGETDTPILSDIQPLDMTVPLAAPTPCRLHDAQSVLTQSDDFAPLETPLTFCQGGHGTHASAAAAR